MIRRLRTAGSWNAKKHDETRHNEEEFCPLVQGEANASIDSSQDELSYYDLIPTIIVVFVCAATFFSAGLATFAEDMLTASIRTFVQLTFLGLLLTPFFRTDRPYLVVAYVILFMLPLAAYEATARTTYTVPSAFFNAWMGLTSGVVSMSVVAVGCVVRPLPWHSPRHVIPLAGMLINNALTSTSLGLTTILDELQDDQHLETLLAFGASPWEAAWPALSKGVTKSLTPLLNSMNVIGLITIPGMMTGQVLSGASPARAAKYQVMIMYVVTGASSVSTVVTMALTVRNVFDNRGIFQTSIVSKNASPRVSQLFSTALSNEKPGKVTTSESRDEKSIPRVVELHPEPVAQTEQQQSLSSPLLVVNAVGQFLGGGTFHASFSVRPGEIATIMGPSGIGKSSLLKSIAEIAGGGILRDDNYHTNIVTLHGKTRHSYDPPSEWRKRVLYIPQAKASVLPGTPSDLLKKLFKLNVQQKQRRSEQQKYFFEVVKYLDEWNLDSSVVLDQPWSSLSGGEGQRVFLAIALSSHPDVLLIDEGTSGLDDDSKRKIEESLSHLSNCAVVMVTHDEDQAARISTSRWRLIETTTSATLPR